MEHLWCIDMAGPSKTMTYGLQDPVGQMDLYKIHLDTFPCYVMM